MSDENKLYLPELCVIPSFVREAKIPGEAKIFYGELYVLSNKHGYCWASNEALAKMKGTDIKTIKRWLTALEKNGFITRQTENKPYQDEKNNLRWKPDRKIFVHNPPKKDCERGKNVPLVREGQKCPQK